MYKGTSRNSQSRVSRIHMRDISAYQSMALNDLDEEKAILAARYTELMHAGFPREFRQEQADIAARLSVINPILKKRNVESNNKGKADKDRIFMDLVRKKLGREAYEELRKEAGAILEAMNG